MDLFRRNKMKGYCLVFSEERLKQLFGLRQEVTILKIVNSPKAAHTFMVLVQDKNGEGYEIAEGGQFPIKTVLDHDEDWKFVRDKYGGERENE